MPCPIVPALWVPRVAVELGPPLGQTFDEGGSHPHRGWRWVGGWVCGLWVGGWMGNRGIECPIICAACCVILQNIPPKDPPDQTRLNV